MKLLQISDPHFGTERPAVLHGLLALAQDLQPDLVLLSGDITQRATAAQFAAARRFADGVVARSASGHSGMPVPLLAIPGNHDLPLLHLLARACWPYARFRAAFGPALENNWDSPALQLTTLDTTRRWRHKDGQLSGAQIARVASRLQRATPQQLRVVVAHHPLAVVRAQDRENLLHGHQAALQAWSAAGADIVLGGHIHLPYVLAVQAQQPALPRPLWVVQAGTALSTRVRHEAGNSVNVLHVGTAPAARAAPVAEEELGPDIVPDIAPAIPLAPETGANSRDTPPAPRHCRVERWDWHADAGAFQRASVHDLPCGGSGV